MTKKTDLLPPSKRPAPKRAGTPRQAARIVTRLARTTLLAAGFAVAQLGIPEIDSRFHLFDPTLLDRLQPPITRHHE